MNSGYPRGSVLPMRGEDFCAFRYLDDLQMHRRLMNTCRVYYSHWPLHRLPRGLPALPPGGALATRSSHQFLTRSASDRVRWRQGAPRLSPVGGAFARLVGLLARWAGRHRRGGAGQWLARFRRVLV